MAAAVTLNATTIEGQLLELLGKIQAMEADSTANPQGVNRITGGFNQDARTYTSSINLNISPGVNPTTGAIEFAAAEFLEPIVNP